MFLFFKECNASMEIINPKFTFYIFGTRTLLIFFHFIFSKVNALRSRKTLKVYTVSFFKHIKKFIKYMSRASLKLQSRKNTNVLYNVAWAYKKKSWFWPQSIKPIRGYWNCIVFFRIFLLEKSNSAFFLLPPKHSWFLYRTKSILFSKNIALSKFPSRLY